MRLLLLTLAAVVASGFAQSRPASLRVYLLVACSAADAGQRVAGGCLQKKPFLTESDVQAAEVQKNAKGQAIIFVTFHADAAVRELNVTKKNIGNRVAIVVNGRVVASPMIAAASRQLFIDGEFTGKQAEGVAAGLNRRIRQKN
jgi:preprotein translocase subunit SecD